MSDYQVKNYVLPEFTQSPTEGGTGAPGEDLESQWDTEEAKAGGTDTFDENFQTEKKKSTPDASAFETPFITEKDIRSLLKKAEEEAAEMLEQAKQEVSRIEKEASERGYEDGKELGLRESREEGKQKLLPCVQAFEKSLKELAACREVTYRNCEAELIELFNALSQKVLHRELSQSHEFIKDIMREAMNELKGQERITVQLNSKDLDYAESFKTDLLTELGGKKNITLKKDDTITRGGCLIETNFGGVDSRVETKIREIEKALLREKPQKEEYKTPLKEPGELSPDAQP